MADSGYFDGFRVPLSSENDRGQVSTHAAILSGPTGKVNHPGHFSPGESAYPAHSSDSVGGRRSKRPGRGRQVFSPRLPTRYPVTYDI